MNYLFFTVFFLCLIAFLDVLITLKRPYILKINFLTLIITIFIINYISFYNIKNGYLYLCLPIYNVIIGSNIVLFINYTISHKMYKWVIYYLSFALISAIIFSISLIINPSIYSFYNEYFTSFYILPQFWYFNIFSFLYKFIILLSLSRIIYEFHNNAQSNNLYKKLLRNWINNFIILLLIVITSLLIFSFFNNKILASMVISITMVIMSYYILLSIIYKPKFLSFHKFNANFIRTFDRNIKSTLTDSNFIVPFFYNHFYLQKDANLDRFCKSFNIDDKDEFHDEIIITYKMSFNNLINKYRVNYFLEIAKSTQFNNYSIDALAQEAGFSSRHHLYKPFKKFHGGTPSDYIYFANN